MEYNYKEIWKDITGYEGLYQVSNYGRVKGLERKVRGKSNSIIIRYESFLKQQKTNKGYTYFTLCKKGKEKKYKVHRLVAQAFIPNNDNKHEVNHIDGNKENNNVNNLEWCTRSENERHKRDVLGYRHSEETKKKMSRNYAGPMIKVRVNGKEFKSLRQASLYHGKNDNYFKDVIRLQKQSLNRYKNWNVEILD